MSRPGSHSRLLILSAYLMLANLFCGEIFCKLPRGFADYPSLPCTFDLGPGNQDVETQFSKYILREDPVRVDEIALGNAGINLSGRDLRRARVHLQLAVIRNVNFDGADLTGAVIDETVFADCSFRRAKLRRIHIYSSIGPGCDLTDADITGSYIHLTKDQLQSTENYRKKDLSFTSISCDCRGLTFTDFNLRGALLHLCDLEGCDFTDSDIRESTIWCRRRADERFPQLPLLSFKQEQLRSTRSYGRRELEEVLFVGCDFGGLDLSGHNLGFFQDCNLLGADLSNASFFGARHPAWYFPQVSNRKSGLVDCDVRPQQFYSTRDYRRGKLPTDFVLERMDLSDWDFSDLDVRGVSFSSSLLNGARLTNTRGGEFEYADGLTFDQVRATWNYTNNKLQEHGLSLPQGLLSKISKKTDPGVD